MMSLVSIVGPTAVGKSSLSISLARDFQGEIINADSRQIYRYMDIGTSKPDDNERTVVLHHLFNIANPDEPFSIALYRKAASDTIAAIRHRGNLPILVGGSGLYVWSLLENWDIPKVPPDISLRKQLEAQAEKQGMDFLYRKLMEIDPEAADKILPDNLRRIIRALEIYELTGQKPSKLQGKGVPSCPVLMIGLTAARTDLYQMIDNRVDDMIKKGLIDEVKRLAALGYHRELPAMSSIGYKQIFAYLDGEVDLEEAVRQIKTKTHAFVRRQYAWFRPGDSRIHWFVNDAMKYSDIIALLHSFLNKIKRNEIGDGFF